MEIDYGGGVENEVQRIEPRAAHAAPPMRWGHGRWRRTAKAKILAIVAVAVAVGSGASLLLLAREKVTHDTRVNVVRLICPLPGFSCIVVCL
jgi:hypothetical protein